MSVYRATRNIEASIIDFITNNVEDDWGNSFTIMRGFSEVYETKPPIIAVRLEDTEHNRIEIGSNNTSRTATVFIDIFATGEGQRLDLKDYLVDILKDRLPYFKYEVSGNIVVSKEANGNLIVQSIADTPINFDADKENLDEQDRHRHLLTLQIESQEVE